MSVLAGQSLTADFTVVGSTGALVNGDSLPTGTLVINGTDNAATVTVTNKTTGTYKAAVTVPATVAIGDVVQIRVNATVSSVASGGYVFTGTVDASVGQAGMTWYVATTGSDSNHGRSTGAPKLTIAAAVTASASGDTIDIGAGTFTEQIATGAKVLTFIGRGWNKTIVTRSTSASATVLNPAPGCKFIGLKLIHTANTAATGSSGINAETTDDIEVRSCWLQGAIDGYTGHHSRNVRIYDSIVVGDWDGGGFEDCANCYAINCTFQTTCEWSWNGSAYTSDLPMHALQATGSSIHLINCVYLADRQHPTTYYTAGIAPGESTVMDGGRISVLSYDATSTGAVYGLRSQTGTVTDMRTVKIAVETAGSGIAAQVSSSGNDILFDNGTGITPTAAVTNGTVIRPATTFTGYSDTLSANIGTTNTRVDATVSSRNALAPLTAAETRTALGMAAADMDTQLDTLAASGGAGLSGPSSVTLTWVDASAAVVPNVDFTIVGQGAATSTALGVKAFGLADGTYTVVSRPTGTTLFANATLVVSGTTTQTITGTTLNVTTPADPALTAAYLTTYDAQGTVAGSTVITFKMEDGVGTTGYSYSTATFTGTSNSSTGLLTINLIKSTSYSARRGNGEWVDFTTGSGSTYALPEILGTL